MIIGIGIDIVDISRLEASMVRYGHRFADRLFTATEQAYCEKMAAKFQHYAARFAGKEAFLKAAGTGLRDGISWHDMEFSNDDLGKPVVSYYGKLAENLDMLNVTAAHVSFSHTGTNAVAVVVLESS
ncbi:holo-ACP synthase [candidate division KSB1 bacterium]|nr:holo-ACP synthase [candidate division KSB1 bacterium]